MSRDPDDDDEPLLGFLFGNVDEDERVDADYLDEDAREQLRGLARLQTDFQTQTGLTEKDLADTGEAASPQASAASAEEDAEDYADEEELIADEEESAAARAPVGAGPSFQLPSTLLAPAGGSEEEEDYDEEEEEADEAEVGVKTLPASASASASEDEEMVGSSEEEEEPGTTRAFPSRPTPRLSLASPTVVELRRCLPTLGADASGERLLNFSELFVQASKGSLRASVFGEPHASGAAPLASPAPLDAPLASPRPARRGPRGREFEPRSSEGDETEVLRARGELVWSEDEEPKEEEEGAGRLGRASDDEGAEELRGKLQASDAKQGDGEGRAEGWEEAERRPGVREWEEEEGDEEGPENSGSAQDEAILLPLHILDWQARVVWEDEEEEEEEGKVEEEEGGEEVTAEEKSPLSAVVEPMEEDEAVEELDAEALAAGTDASLNAKPPSSTEPPSISEPPSPQPDPLQRLTAWSTSSTPLPDSEDEELAEQGLVRPPPLLRGLRVLLPPNSDPGENEEAPPPLLSMRPSVPGGWEARVSWGVPAAHSSAPWLDLNDPSLLCQLAQHALPARAAELLGQWRRQAAAAILEIPSVPSRQLQVLQTLRSAPGRSDPAPAPSAAQLLAALNVSQDAQYGQQPRRRAAAALGRPAAHARPAVELSTIPIQLNAAERDAFHRPRGLWCPWGARRLPKGAVPKKSAGLGASGTPLASVTLVSLPGVHRSFTAVDADATSLRALWENLLAASPEFGEAELGVGAAGDAGGVGSKEGDKRDKEGDEKEDKEGKKSSRGEKNSQEEKNSPGEQNSQGEPKTERDDAAKLEKAAPAVKPDPSASPAPDSPPPGGMEQPLLLAPGAPPAPLPLASLVRLAVGPGDHRAILSVTFRDAVVLPSARACALPQESNPALLRAPQAFTRRAELSAALAGHVLLAEFLEERPPLLARPGMGARLVTYYRRRGAADAGHVALSEDADRPWRRGAVAPLGDDDETPFLGEVPPGEAQLALESGLFRAPAAAHEPLDSDFLLIRTPGGRMALRELTGVVSVGQELPLHRIPYPNSRDLKDLEERRMFVHVFKRLRRQVARLEKKAGALGPGAHPSALEALRPGVSLKQLKDLFPTRPESMIRLYLRDACELVLSPLARRGDDEVYEPRAGARLPSEVELRRKFTPDEAAVLEAAYVADHRLRSRGIRLHERFSGVSAEKLSMAAAMLAPGELTVRAANRVEMAAAAPVWALTDAFVTSFKEGRANLRLEGPADPSGRGLGYSFVRDVRHKSAGDDGPRGTARRAAGKVQGTDADLRRMTTEQARARLLDFGLTPAEVEPLSRWDRIDLVRQFANAAAADGAQGPLKFVRHQKTTLLEHQAAQKVKAQRIFKRQTAVLRGEEVPCAPEAEEEAEPGGATGGSGSQDPGKGGRSAQAAREEDELAELEAMRAAGLLASAPQANKAEAAPETAQPSSSSGAAIPGLSAAARAPPASASQTRRIRRVVQLRQADGSWLPSHEVIYAGRDAPYMLASLYAGEGAGQGVWGFGQRTISGRARGLPKLSYSAARGRGLGRGGRGGRAAGTGGRGRGRGRGRARSPVLDDEEEELELSPDEEEAQGPDSADEAPAPKRPSKPKEPRAPRPPAAPKIPRPTLEEELQQLSSESELDLSAEDSSDYVPEEDGGPPRPERPERRRGPREGGIQELRIAPPAPLPLPTLKLKLDVGRACDDAAAGGGGTPSAPQLGAIPRAAPPLQPPPRPSPSSEAGAPKLKLKLKLSKEEGAPPPRAARRGQYRALAEDWGGSSEDGAGDDDFVPGRGPGAPLDSSEGSEDERAGDDRLKRDKLWKLYFAGPVTSAVAPDYRDWVHPSQEMYLDKIQKKTAGGKYVDVQGFLDDVAVILTAAKLYNAPGHGRHGGPDIIQLAEKLLGDAEAEVAAAQGDIAQANALWEAPAPALGGVPPPAVVEEQWVQCSACHKWRIVSPQVHAAAVSEDRPWYCAMNTERLGASCDDVDDEVAQAQAQAAVAQAAVQAGLPPPAHALPPAL